MAITEPHPNAICIFFRKSFLILKIMKKLKQANIHENSNTMDNQQRIFLQLLKSFILISSVESM